jgi:hypothetical protein
LRDLGADAFELTSHLLGERGKAGGLGALSELALRFELFQVLAGFEQHTGAQRQRVHDKKRGKAEKRDEENEAQGPFDVEQQQIE